MVLLPDFHNYCFDCYLTLGLDPGQASGPKLHQSEWAYLVSLSFKAMLLRHGCCFSTKAQLNFVESRGYLYLRLKCSHLYVISKILQKGREHLCLPSFLFYARKKQWLLTDFSLRQFCFEHLETYFILPPFSLRLRRAIYASRTQTIDIGIFHTYIKTLQMLAVTR